MRISGVVIASLFLTTSLAFATDLKKLEKQQLQVDRLGPIAVGMTVKEASEKSGIKLKETEPSDSGNEECYYVYPDGKYGDIGFMIEEERISRIDITSRKFASIHGLRVGDTEASVKKAFPGKVKEQAHPYLEEDGKYLIIKLKPGYGFIFETEKGKVTSFRSGKFESIQYIEGCN
ncbi:hypothetical protein Geob_0977 [Geotalea daltonii FRC-32]|uniref:Beta-lactamase-inhibitor-like PepSY-like domain-containing protein n=1 Tax=Geotalea daltonii (strain DSM 22248 / JCM 15807 / FRC-32) TaxID=316067 RepID=B9M2G0_GEODF|nr:hypothetical protein [Geotalea daltonii]ACM19339.1 hypothetical protein Geob_0977 [Geotalea daltonii FRC-32]